MMNKICIIWVGWAIAFTGKFISFNRFRGACEHVYSWTLWLGPLEISRLHVPGDR